MKYLFTLFLGYVAPSIIHSINLDIVLGITAGILLGALITALFIGPSQTPSPRHAPTKTTVRKPTQRKPRKIIEQASQIQHGLNVFNYQPTEWGIA